MMEASKGANALPPRIRALVAVAILSLFAIVYLGSSYRLGFDWGDVGSYAQICYEQLFDSTLGDFRQYAPLWYLPGVALFQLGGASFSAVLVYFQILILVSAILLLFAVKIATRSIRAGVLAGMLFLLVPPAFAETVRSLGVGLVLPPFVLIASRERNRHWALFLVAAGLGVGVNFLTRPDFGYLYAVTLSVLLIARAWREIGPLSIRVRECLADHAIALSMVAALLAAMSLYAAASHFLPEWIDELSLRRLATKGFGWSHADHKKGSLLPLLPLSALVNGNTGSRMFAFLIYSSLLFLIGFALWLTVNWFTGRREKTELLTGMALFGLVGCQWPIFAIFRPDWIHFIDFAHVYIALAVYLAVMLARGRLRPGRGRAAACATLLTLLAAQMVIFIVYGELAPQTGWLSRVATYDTPFQSGNDVDVKVARWEAAYMTQLDKIVRENSRPGDKIVCVPYCAGFVFMTERRMFLKDMYVDDSTPLIFPGWMEQTLEQIRQAPPPVIIVLDWATNGTEESRFSVWAAPIMEYVKSTYSKKIRFAAGTVWVR